MNTTENLVELYYREKGYFTIDDVKVNGGNNRQLDLVACNLITGKNLHIEVSVTHS